MFYLAAVWSVKLSLLLLYLRIFLSKTFHRIVYGIMALLILSFVAVFISWFTLCRPISAYWDGKGDCANVTAYLKAVGSFNAGLDFVVWVLPIPMVWKLQLPIFRKIELSIVFLLGLL